MRAGELGLGLLSVAKAMLFLGVLGITTLGASQCPSCSGIVSRDVVWVARLPPYDEQLRQAIARDLAAPPPSSSYHGPGYAFVMSRDGRWLAFSKGAANSYYTIVVWDETTRIAADILSVREADPGSGYSHRYAWSEDSLALLVFGRGATPEILGSRSDAALCLIYTVEKRILYGLTECTAK